VRLNGLCVRARLLRLVPGLIAATVTSHAHGLEVGLDVRDCADLAQARVRELTALELRTRVVAPEAPRRPGALVIVSCTGAQVAVRVTDSMTEKVVMRTFTLREVEPDVRARAVALAVTELVLTSWLELTLPQPTQNQPWAGSPTSEDRREASAIAHRRTSRGAHIDAAFAFAEVGGTFRATPRTYGLGVRLSVVLGEPILGLDADLSATWASQRTDLGRVRVNTWGLAIRPALRLERGPWLGTVGVGARVGLARIEGSPADPSASRGSTLVGTWAGPLVHANVGVTFAHFSARLGGESGFALRGVSGSVNGADQAGVRGAWVLASLGFGWGS
jgi:hypothetical protein